MSSSSVADRLARRYPPSRVPRWAVIVGVLVLAAVSLTWLVITAGRQSQPPVSAQVTTFDIVSDREAKYELTVQRPDPSVEASCTLIAQATNHERVGEILDLRIPPSEHELVRVRGSIETFRRATSVSLEGCTPVE
ncbi:DUF4307 domain-containing protein [Enemella sp. A6]|uniref:DUF4307 domain-containing protein n=1 Tax=Enemella sp. A6 TaxID=3440152 RepID=UPI003EB7A948